MFQFLIGRVKITSLYDKKFEYREFQFLIGRVKINYPYCQCLYKIYVSIPYR